MIRQATIVAGFASGHTRPANGKGLTPSQIPKSYGRHLAPSDRNFTTQYFEKPHSRPPLPPERTPTNSGGPWAVRAFFTGSRRASGAQKRGAPR